MAKVFSSRQIISLCWLLSIFLVQVSARRYLGSCNYEGFCEHECRRVTIQFMECYCRAGYMIKDGRKCVKAPEGYVPPSDTDGSGSGDLEYSGSHQSNCDNEDGDCGEGDKEEMSGDGVDAEITEQPEIVRKETVSTAITATHAIDAMPSSVSAESSIKPSVSAIQSAFTISIPAVVTKATPLAVIRHSPSFVLKNVTHSSTKVKQSLSIVERKSLSTVILHQTEILTPRGINSVSVSPKAPTAVSLLTSPTKKLKFIASSSKPHSVKESKSLKEIPTTESPEKTTSTEPQETPKTPSTESEELSKTASTESEESPKTASTESEESPKTASTELQETPRTASTESTESREMPTTAVTTETVDDIQTTPTETATTTTEEELETTSGQTLPTTSRTRRPSKNIIETPSNEVDDENPDRTAKMNICYMNNCVCGRCMIDNNVVTCNCAKAVTQGRGMGVVVRGSLKLLTLCFLLVMIIHSGIH